jgi:hypothetical protein
VSKLCNVGETEGVALGVATALVGGVDGTVFVVAGAAVVAGALVVGAGGVTGFAGALAATAAAFVVTGMVATFAGTLVVATAAFVVAGAVTGFTGGFVPATAAFVAAVFTGALVAAAGEAGWGACAIAETLSTTPNPTPIRRFERNVNTNPSLPKLRTPKQDQSLCVESSGYDILIINKWSAGSPAAKRIRSWHVLAGRAARAPPIDLWLIPAVSGAALLK